VFAVEGGKAALRDVQIGLRGEDLYEVLDGLQEGDVVILRPPSDLEPGGRVEAVEAQ
jgi:HlyD family secretion protein